MYSLRYTKKALKALKKMPPKEKKTIERGLDAIRHDPRSKGKALKAGLTGSWRYRFGSYRAVCDIKDDELVVVVIKADHRSRVYRVE